MTQNLPQTDPEILSSLGVTWQRVMIHSLLLLWITELLGKRQSDPNDGLGVTAFEETFKKFVESHNLKINFKLDGATSLVGFAYPIIIDLIESRKMLDPSDKSLLDGKFESNFGEYSQQIDQFSINVREMRGEIRGNHSQMTSYTVLIRLRNSLSHGRYKYGEEKNLISFMDKTSFEGELTADFDFEPLQFINFIYCSTVSFIKATQETGLFPKN